MLCLIHRGNVVSWRAEMDEVDAIACGMADRNDSATGVVCDAANAIAVLFMRETDFLNGLPETKVPEL